MDTPIIAVQFSGQNIRTDAEGRVSVMDALSAIGVKKPRDAWKRLSGERPELVHLAGRVKVGRTTTPFMDAEGITQVLMAVQTRYLNAKGRKLVSEFRSWLANLAVRVAGNDITLAAEIADKASTQDQAWLKERVESSLGAKALSASIAEAGCSQRTYSKAHDMNNVAITGMTAREIQKYRQGRVTRDLYETSELALLNAAQTLEVATIKARGAKGDGHVLSIVSSISNDIADLRRKWLGERTYPVDGLLTVGV